MTNPTVLEGLGATGIPGLGPSSGGGKTSNGVGPIRVQEAFNGALATQVGSLVVTLPQAPTPGNYLVAVIATTVGNTLTAPSGWALKFSKLNSDIGILVYQKLATSSDTASTTWLWGASTDFYSVEVYEFSGTSGIDQTGVSTGTTGATASLTPSATGSLGVTAFCSNNGSTTAAYAQPTLNSGWIPDWWSLPHFKAFATALQSNLGIAAVTATWSPATSDQCAVIFNMAAASITGYVNAYAGRTGLVVPLPSDVLGFSDLLPRQIGAQANLQVGDLGIVTENGLQYNVLVPTTRRDGTALRGGETFGAFCTNGAGNLGAIIDFSDVGQKVFGPGLGVAGGIECLLSAPGAYAVFVYDAVTTGWYIVAGAQDTGWTTWSTSGLLNSWTALAGGVAPSFRGIGDKVYNRGSLTPGGASGTIATKMFSGQFPGANVLNYPLGCVLAGAPSVAQADIAAATGNVTIRYPASATAISLDNLIYSTD